MLRFCTSLICIFVLASGFSQDKTIDLNPKDTTAYKQVYGLRAGIDISRLINSFVNDNYTGLEIVGDYRLSQKLYLAAEIGNEKKTKQEDLYNFTTSGSYFKAGIDFNSYGNWYGEQNMITLGGRFAVSNFSQTINNYQLFDSSRYWSPTRFIDGSGNVQREFNGRTKSWVEAVVGVKMELVKNLYVGGSIRMGFLVRFQ